MEAVTDRGCLLRSETSVTPDTSRSPLHPNTPASSVLSSPRSTPDPQSGTQSGPPDAASADENAEMSEVANDQGDDLSTNVGQKDYEDFDEGMLHAQNGGLGVPDGGNDSDDEDDSDDEEGSGDRDGSDSEDDSKNGAGSSERSSSSESSEESEDDADDDYFSTPHSSHPLRETELDATDVEDLEDSRAKEGKKPLPSRSTDRTIIRNTLQAIAALEACGIERTFIDNHRKHIDLFVSRDSAAYAWGLSKLRKTPGYKSSDANLQALEAAECQRVLAHRIKGTLDFESQIREVMAREGRLGRLVTIEEVKQRTSRGRSAKTATPMSATPMSERPIRVRPRVAAKPRREFVSVEGMGTMPLPDDIKDEAMALLDDILRETFLSERDEAYMGSQKRKVKTEDVDQGPKRGRAKRSRT